MNPMKIFVPRSMHNDHNAMGWAALVVMHRQPTLEAMPPSRFPIRVRTRTAVFTRCQPLQLVCTVTTRSSLVHATHPQISETQVLNCTTIDQRFRWAERIRPRLGMPEKAKHGGRHQELNASQRCRTHRLGSRS